MNTLLLSAQRPSARALRALGLALIVVALHGCFGDDESVQGPDAVAGADTASQDGAIGAHDAVLDGGHAGQDAVQSDSGPVPDGAPVEDTDVSAVDGGPGTDQDGGPGGGDLDIVALTLEPPAFSLPVGGQATLVLSAKFADGSSEDVGAIATWSSTAPGLVAVAKGGQLTALAAGVAEIRATVGAHTASSKVTVVAAALVSLEIQPTDATLAVGAVLQLGAVGTFADGSQQNLGLAVAWSSDTPGVVEVVQGGLASAKAAGKAIVTAKLGSVTASAVLTVLTAKVVELVVEPVDPTLALGASLKMTAIASYDDGSKGDVSSAVTWNSASPDVVKIAADGTVTALAVGSSVLSAVYAGQEATRIVTVVAPKLTQLAIDPPDMVLAAGGSAQFKAFGTFDDGKSADLTLAVTWSIAPPGVASISNAPGSQGKLTATAPGSALVMASYGGQAVTAKVTVSKATLQALAIEPAKPSVPKGVTLQLVAIGTLSDGSVQDVTSLVVWASSAPAIATVSSTGKTAGQAAALAVGKTTLSASLDGKVASVELLVSAAALTSVKVVPDKLSLEVGGQKALAAVATYSDKSEVTVTASAVWKVGDTAVVEVQNAAGSQGVVTAKAQGSTTVTATIGTVSGQATVEVKAPTLTALQIGPINPQRKAGEQLQFFVTAVYSNQATQNVTFQSEWSSDNIAVASVGNDGNQKGRAQAKNAGKAMISAAFGGKTVSTTLTVTDPEVMSIEISPAYWELNAGTPMQLQAVAIFTDGSSQNVTFQAQWSSANAQIAVVGNSGGGGGGGGGPGQQPKGRVLAMTPGTVTITATAQGLTGKATIVVKPAVPTALSLFPGLQSCAPGQFRQIEATLIYSDGSSVPITQFATYQSTAQAVAAALNGQGQKGLVQCLSPGKATITATFQGFSANVAVDVSSAELSSIAIAPGAATVAAGVPVPLQVSAYYSDGTSQTVTGQATLTSSDVKVAAVIDAGPLSGVVQTLAQGKATITASFNGKKATAAITVTTATVAEIQITPAAPAVAPGSWVKFEAVAVMTDNTVQQITILASWASSAPAVAAIDNTNGFLGKGLCQALTAGSTEISATWAGKTGKTKLTVNPASLTEIQVTPFVATLPVGYLTLFKATGIYSDFTTQDLTQSASWSSSKTAIASVNSTLGSKGQVMPLAAGSADIVVSYLGKTGKVAITVTEAKLQAIAVTPATSSLTLGKSTQLQALGTFVGGLQLDITPYVTWLTKPAGVVGISNALGSKGLATALGKGNAAVEAIRDGVTGTAAIVVQ